jgi:hypothetical protein
MKHHYNTTRESGQLALMYDETAAGQEQLIVEFFERFPGELFTPFDIQTAVLPRAPITSVRRAITNLCADGRLVKTDTKRAGPYGRPCYCWRTLTASERLIGSVPCGPRRK